MGSCALNRAERDLLERMQFIPCVQSIHECSAVTARSQQSLISQQSFEKVSHHVYPVHVASSKLECAVESEKVKHVTCPGECVLHQNADAGHDSVESVTAVGDKSFGDHSEVITLVVPAAAMEAAAA